MIYWIIIIAFLASAVWVAVGWHNDWDSTMFALILSALSLVVVLISSVIVIGVNSPGIVQADIEANKQRYASLVYQLENHVYENDNDLGKQDLYQKVTNWNEDLAYGKVMQHDFWFGIFTEDIFDEFEFINLEEYEVVNMNDTDRACT